MSPPSQVIQDLAAELARQEALRAALPSRKARIGQLRAVLRGIDVLVGAIQNAPPVVTSVLRAQVLPLLGSLLTTSAFAGLAGVSAIWSGDDRRLGELIKDCRDEARGAWHISELIGGLDDVTRAQRMGVAADLGPRLLVQLLEALREPLHRALVIEELTGAKGGRLSNWKRDFVIAALIPVYERQSGRTAAATKGGPFTEYCADALRALGLDEAGVEDAVATILNRRRGLNAPARPRGRPPRK